MKKQQTRVGSRRRKLVMVGTAIATAALVLSGCASNDAGAGSDATGEPIKVGMICDCSGFTASAWGLSDDIAKAWETQTNEAGGINGHPVEVIIEDTGSDPTKALKAAKKLVEEDGVVAIAGSNTNHFTTIQQYVDSVGVPIIGGVPYDTPMYTNANFFPIGGSLAADMYAVAQAGSEDGATNWGLMYCAEAPVCGLLGTTYSEMIKKVFDAEVSYEAKIASDLPSYQAQCLAAEEANVDAMFIVSSSGIVAKVIQDCADAGISFPQYNVGGDVGAEVLAIPEANDMQVVQGTLPLVDTTTQGGKAYNKLVDDYAPKLRDESNYNESLGRAWGGLQLFKIAAEAVELGPDATFDDVKAGLYSLKAETLGGFTPPLTFKEGEPTRILCSFYEEIQDGAYLMPGGTEPVCVPDKETAEKLQAIFG